MAAPNQKPNFSEEEFNKEQLEYAINQAIFQVNVAIAQSKGSEFEDKLSHDLSNAKDALKNCQEKL